LTLRNWTSRHGSELGLRAVLLLAALLGVLLADSTKGTLAQNPPPTDGGTKPAEKPKAKTDADAPTSPRPDSKVTDAAVDPNAYHIGLDDQLLISVWREPELSMTVVVRPDGMITMPLINDLHVVGLKPIELQQLLIEKLKPFVSEPQVTVIVQGIHSRKVYLVGNVGRQGAFPLEGGQTVLQLLAASGGVNQFGKADSIYILRTENNKQIRIPFQYKKALKGRVKDDVLLQPGDVVVVP
jgi:polysaccharide export outer membrane protein